MSLHAILAQHIRISISAALAAVETDAEFWARLDHEDASELARLEATYPTEADRAEFESWLDSLDPVAEMRSWYDAAGPFSQWLDENGGPA